MTTTIEEGKLTIERIFDAPPAVVWSLWTEPEHMMKWWGPEHFTAPVIQIDLRVGGKYLFAMQDGEGKRYWSTGTYTEISPYTRLVYTDSFADENGNVVSPTDYGVPGDFPMELIVEVDLQPLDDGRKTRMLLTNLGMPAAAAEWGASEGWNTSFNKLAAAVAALVP
jgi:uncharacterized protein YndB with AHSA1/START domain